MHLVPPVPGSVNIIVACDDARGIGLKGRLPWRIREDWQWFMGHTRGGACVIGRLSYEAMLRGGHVNADRRYFVVSRDSGLAGPHTQVYTTTGDALAAARASGLVTWICGGTRIYEESLPIAQRLYLTQVHTRAEVDAWMPDWTSHFGHVIYEFVSADAKYKYTFKVLEPLASGL
jgi:dihydrofolate reductase